MADNITLNQNTTSGSVLATDEIGGVHYQINKISFGALESSTLVSSANPLPITVISNPAAPSISIPAGAAIIGKVGIDQSTPGTTDSVTVKTAGQKTAAQSLAVVEASDGLFATNFGAKADAAATTDTGTFTFLALIKRLLTKLPIGQTTSAGSLSVTSASDATFKLAAGTALIGSAGIDQTTDGTTNAVSIKSYSGTFLNATTTAYATSLIVKASAGKLVAIKGYNSKASGQFIQVHDSATLPADGSVPKVIYYVPASSNFEITFHDFGRAFTNGIVVCNSSTGPTKTIGAADIWVDVRYL